MVAQSVRKRLREAGAGPLRSRRPYRGIVLTLRHLMTRLRWARRYVRFTRADWARVLFTDEKRFGSYSNDGRVRIYRRRGEIYSTSCILQTEHFGGGSVMLWAGISTHQDAFRNNQRKFDSDTLPE